jgi:formylglycine-generating enzyme required for sulfatase activity
MTLKNWAALAFALVAGANVFAVDIDTVSVGNPGNAADTEIMITDATTGYGSVAYSFRMGTYEVTNAQYVEFLNGVDPVGTNTLELYRADMTTDARGGIIFDGIGANGAKYRLKPGRDDNPVVYVSWFDAVRFANWMHNGQGSSDTETGAYTLLGGTPTPSNASSITRNPGAKWWLPSENEWYKAAYHKNDGIGSSYWDFPTSTDVLPVSDQPPGTDAPTPSNAANFNENDALPNGYNDGYAVTGSPTFVASQNYLTNVGAYTSSVSPYGTYDQGGNVWEWTESLFANGHRNLRGSSWDNDSPTILRSAYRISTAAGDGFNLLGFRVATVPEPSSIILAVSCAALFSFRSRPRRLRCSR